MQRTFKEHKQSFVDHTGIPFLHDNAGLLRLDTQDVLDEFVVTTVRCVKKLGMEYIMNLSLRTGVPQFMK